MDAKQHLTDLIKNITDHGYDEEVRSLTVWVCGINAEENREKIIYGHYESDYLLYSLDDEDDIPKMQLNEENNWSEDWESSDLYFLKNIQLLDTLNSKFWKTQPTPWKKFLKDN